MTSLTRMEIGGHFEPEAQASGSKWPPIFWPFCKRAITVVILVQCFGDCGLCHGTKICSTFVLFLRLCRLLTGLDQF